jgi:phosphoribosylformimino-5-aminoimidazole carboxamide ribotide isomerase
MVEPIPAIDLRRGRCVRLAQGRYDLEVSYSADPVEVARRWVSQGARRLHLVDLDGAREGKMTQGRVVEAVAAGCGVPVQLGGGLRSEADVQAAFDAGADRAILGTAALEDPAMLERSLARWGERIAVAVDVRDGQPVVRGWEQEGEEALGDLLKRLRRTGVRRVIASDVTRDGMLEGPNLILAATVARLFGGAVIASGGFSSRADLERARRLEILGLEGVVLGKALYEGRLTLAEALECLGGGAGRAPSAGPRAEPED